MIEHSLFEALQNIDTDQMEGKDLTSVLPYLAKLLLSPTFIKRRQLLHLLYPIRKMNDVVQLLQARNIETSEGLAPSSLSFEASNSSERLRIVATEYIRIQDRVRQTNFAQNSLRLLQSDLFDNPIYVDDISYCLCALLIKSATIPVINILDMSEALLYVEFGRDYIVRLVANMPERILEVCQSLITHGECHDEGANFCGLPERRAKTVRTLCRINPAVAFTVRSLTLQLCKMPSLTIMITLDQLESSMEKYNALEKERLSVSDDSNSSMDVSDLEVGLMKSFNQLEDTFDSAIAFITGILLGVDEGTRVWFAQYLKSAQQKLSDQNQYNVLSRFRSQILDHMNKIFAALLDEECWRDDSTELPMKVIERNKKIIRANATLRLFCALRGIGSLKLDAEESEILLRLITCKPAVNQTSVNFATTGVCTLLACSALINNQKDERRAAEWLKWLIRESNFSDNRYSSHGKCSISELLLLIAIHFQNNQTNQIAELVCATLGMKLQIKASVSKCKSLFVQEVFNDQMVAEHAVKVPVTKNLNNSITEFLPVHCIHQLLESRSFSKHQVPIKDWIYRQICESMKPIHQILPRLIEAYVHSVLVSTSAHGHCGTNQALSEEEIARVFEVQLYSKGNDSKILSRMENGLDQEPVRKKHKRGNGTASTSNEVNNLHSGESTEQPKIVDVEAAQVLMLYYLVFYEDVRLKRNADMSASERAKLVRYNPDFMLEIPVFYLLQLVRDNQNSFGTILPDLLKLVTSQYPQLCSIQHWLNIDHYVPLISGTDDHPSVEIKELLETSTLKVTNKTETAHKPVEVIKENLRIQLVKAFNDIEKDPQDLTRILSQITMLPKEKIWPFVDIFIENMPKIVSLKVGDSPEYKKLVQATTKLWWKFNTIFPRKLWVMTVNALKRPPNLKISLDVTPVEYSWDELALDPLIVLRCDSRVFRCVDVLDIVLHILSAFLAASRRCLQDQINEQACQKVVRNLEELRTTLILAQTSAAIQILLESCLPTDEEREVITKRENGDDLNVDEKLLLDRFDASVNCICEHLHQVFIADTNLAKLVHFQTYPSELLATTSDKIPSMHICLDFIPELLSQPDLSKQVFVIELTSHLCEKYAITKSLNVAKLCFNVAYTLLQLLPSVRRALFFIPVLPALLRICKVFPILREDAEIILNQINQITLAHMASTSSRLSLGSARPFEGLEKMSWREANKLMSTLSLHEALYLCIQKCSLQGAPVINKSGFV